MHDHGHFSNALAIILGIPRENTHVVYPYYAPPMDSFKEEIKAHRDKVIVIVGQDETAKWFFDPLDEWDYLDSMPNPILVVDVDYLDPCKKPYKRLQRVWFNQNCMANLEVLLLHQPLMDFAYSKGPWLSLMRGLHPHRTYTFEKYISRLASNFLYSYGDRNFLGPDPNFDSSERFTFGPELLNNNNFFTLLPWFNRCGASVVCETCKDFTLTEKTFHAIMAGHPFLLIGMQGSVRYLRNQGFDVFDDFFNHEYDLCSDINQRIDRLFRDNAAILAEQIDRSCIADRLIKNRQHLWSYRNNVTRQLFKDIMTCYPGRQPININQE